MVKIETSPLSEPVGSISQFPPLAAAKFMGDVMGKKFLIGSLSSSTTVADLLLLHRDFPACRMSMN
jgi:hypothetical protein